MEHKINFSDSEFGTLLGPEETPGPPFWWGWVFFLAASGLDRLTHSVVVVCAPCVVCVLWLVGVVVVVGLGCGCVLSVA